MPFHDISLTSRRCHLCSVDADLSEDWMTASGDLKEGNLNINVSDP